MSAPSAVVLQMSAAIPEDSIERPAAGGRYAMASTDMDWYIDFFNELQPSGPRGRAAGTTAVASPHGSEKSGRTRRVPDERPQGPKGE